MLDASVGSTAGSRGGGSLRWERATRMERHEAELEITGGRERLRDGRKERRKGRRRWQGGEKQSPEEAAPGDGVWHCGRKWEEIGAWKK